MLSRGYEGVLPHDEVEKSKATSWFVVLMYPFVAVVILVTTTLIGNQ
jgi:hypothetical protein